MTKPPPTIAGIARPLRVAYFVDPDDCFDAQLDSIFLEAYGRWGGRRTLIVPAKPDGIDARFSDWLFHFDADIIYSFVDLRDGAVAAVHEKCGPAHFVHHSPIGICSPGERSFRIELPITGLRSLSVVPALLTRSWGVGERLQNPRIIDKFSDQTDSKFIRENFGFLTDLYSPVTGRSFPDLFGILSLISSEALNNPYFGKASTSVYLTEEREILEVLGNPSSILTLSAASDLFAPYLVTDYSEWSGGFTLVVGDTFSDRLLFWHQHLRQQDTWIGAVPALRLPASRLGDEQFIEAA